MEKPIFLFLSFISGYVELGGLIYAISMELSILKIVGIGLAYQLGNLVPNPINFNKKFTFISSFLGLICFCYLKFYSFNYYILFLAYIFIAMSIQSLRSIQKDKVSTTTKRSFRILGFLLSPFIEISIATIISLLLLIICTHTKWSNNKVKFEKPKFRFINIVMVVHQIHYFSYAYFILILISNIINIKDIWLIGILFTFGWLTYISVPHILRGNMFQKYLIIGHIFLTIVLFSLAQSSNATILIILWILTGFGGGTVFCIEKLNHITNECRKSDIVFSENIGHIIGVLLGMLAYLLSYNIKLPIYLSSAFASLTAMLMIINSSTVFKKQITYKSNHLTK